MSVLWQDIRYGLRMLTKNLGFTTVATLSLALGIGASASIFSLINAILLRSLPVPNPHELRTIQWAGDDLKFNGISGGWSLRDGREVGDGFSYPVFENLREQCAGEADIFGFKETDKVIVRARREAFSAEGLLTSDNFFSALQARPLIGRLFIPGESTEGDALETIISYSLWERQFDLDPSALGQSLTIDGHSFTVIGILPRGFPSIRPGNEFEFYVSMAAQPQLRSDCQLANPGRWWVPLIARIKPGVSESQLQASLDVAFAHASDQWMTNTKIYMDDGRRGARDYEQDEYKKPLMLLFGIVGVVALVVCANLAGLLLARGAARQHEFSVRAAVGAGRWRMIRQTLTENVLLCMIGSGFGLLFALWGKDLVARLLTGKPDGLRYDTSLDLRVLGFVLAVSVATALISGLLPALRAAYRDPLPGLKSHAVLGTNRLRSGKTLVIAQMAFSLLLLTGAGLYVRTLVNIVMIDPGFAMEKLLWLEVNPGKAGYQGQEIEEYFDRTQSALAAIPGVRSTALSHLALLTGWCTNGHFFTLPDHPNAQGSMPYRLTVGETFFTTMDIPLRVGRVFTAADTANAPKIVVVNETFVQQYLPDVYPIGQILRVKDTDWQIVGVCADAKYNNIKQEIPPTVYFPCRQDSIFRREHSAFIAINSNLTPSTIVNGVRRTMAAVDPNVPILRIATQKQLRDKLISSEWMFAILCSALAILAVMLACIGLYGLMAYNVSQRTNEIGIRMALGATGRRIFWPILRDALLMAMAGALLGGLGALGITRLIQSQLYGVASTDPMTFAIAILAIFIIAALAALIPARRAANVDPMIALRCE
ncbi:MAG: ABC transporter permease [Candidatus Omnitrophota bacterium]